MQASNNPQTHDDDVKAITQEIRQHLLPDLILGEPIEAVLRNTGLSSGLLAFRWRWAAAGGVGTDHADHRVVGAAAVIVANAVADVVADVAARTGSGQATRRIVGAVAGAVARAVAVLVAVRRRRGAGFDAVQRGGSGRGG